MLRLSAKVIKGVGEQVGQAETGQLSESENLADIKNTDHSGTIKNVASGCDNRYERNTLSEDGEVKVMNPNLYRNKSRNNAECEWTFDLGLHSNNLASLNHNTALDGFGTGNRSAEHLSKGDDRLQLLRIRKNTYQHLLDGVLTWFAGLIVVCSQHILRILSDAIEDLTRDEDFTGERALTVSVSEYQLKLNPWKTKQLSSITVG